MVSLAIYTQAYMNLFKGREDLFAQQQTDGSYVPKRHPFREIEVKYHLFQTVSTYGVYPIMSNGKVWFCCIDIDIEIQQLIQYESQYGRKQGQKILLKKIHEETIKQSKHLKKLKLPHAIEFSGRRGYHIWLFFGEALPASFVVKLKDKLLVQKDPSLMSKDTHDKYYEFFPKQSYVGSGGVGNLIKLPLGVHKVSGNRCLFLDPDTYDIIDHQFDYLVEMDKNYRIQPQYLENLVGEKIEKYIEIEKKKQSKRRKSGHLNTRFDIQVPDDTNVHFHEVVLPEMISLVNNPPMDDSLLIKKNVDKTPPCIYHCYITALTRDRIFEERMVLVRYFANVKSKYSKYMYCYTPSDIAGFFKYHVNDDQDNMSPDRLTYYVSYAYGTLQDPLRLENCETMQKNGWCLNFNFKAFDVEQDVKEIMDIKTTDKLIKQNIKDMETWEEESKLKPEIYKGIDIIEVRKEINKSNKELYETIEKNIKSINDKFQIKCERIWHPLSFNNEFRQIKDNSMKYSDVFYLELIINTLNILFNSFI
jgi:hypothetical protein